MWLENGVLAAWGGRSVCVLSGTELLEGKSGREIRLDNWVTTAAFAVNDPSTLYCLMAHNVVLKLVEGAVTDKFTCDERSILYSGSLKPLSNGSNDVLVASGTVLGGVVVWDLVTGQIKHNFTTHEGSIFGLAFSQNGDRLISCSDDRSIRLWDLQTGEQVSVGWGHLARIWSLEFFDQKTIVSVSEDCTARVWNITGDKLETSQVLEGHLGRNVWSGAIHHDASILATGGGDGRIRLWDLERKTRVDTHREQFSLEDTQRDIVTLLAKGEIFKNYTQLNGNMVVATSRGRIIVLDTKLHFREVSLSENGDVDTYLIVKGWETANVAAIASRDGLVYLLHMTTDQVEVVQNNLQSKLTDIILWSLNDKYYVLAQSQNPKDKFIITRLGFVDGVLKQEKTYELEPPATFLATSAVMHNEETLLFGSRHGSIAAYDLSSEVPAQVWRHVAGSSDSITSLTFIQNSLHFTTRGGQFGVAEFQNSTAAMDLSIISSNKLQRGSIEGSIISDNQKLLYGFKHDLFFIWNETKQYEVMSEKCGGPHRAWNITLSETDPSHYRFIYTKASKVVLTSSDALEAKYVNTLVQDGTHGREIRDIAFSPKLYNFGRIVATASEDTCINLATIDTNSQLKNHCTLRNHVSGLQKLKWSQDGVHLFSSAAREEFVVWKVSLTKEQSVYATPVATLPTSSDNPDLRVMDFLVQALSDTLSLVVTVYSDSAIRLWVLDTTTYKFTSIASGMYRTCCILHVNLIATNFKAHLLISSTDGHVVAWDISNILTDAGITVSETQLTCTDVKQKSAVLDAPSLSLAVHQSSVKDYTLVPCKDTFYHISGGDDNSITLAELDFNAAKFTKIAHIPSAHSAAITGVASVPGNGRAFVTVGVDQNVRLWQISSEWDQIQLVDQKYTTVADTGTLDVALFNENKVGVMIGGSGLSFWTLV